MREAIINLLFFALIFLGGAAWGSWMNEKLNKREDRKEEKKNAANHSVPGQRRRRNAA